MTEGRVKNLLMVGTVPHQLTSGAEVIEKTPGSGVLDKDVTTTLIEKGIKVFNFFPSFFHRDNPRIRTLLLGQESPHQGLRHNVPIFTSTPLSDYRFDQMTKEGFIRYMKIFTKELASFIRRIEEAEGPLDVAHVAHLFNNMVAMAMINRSRIQNGERAIPVVAQAHGTALKFFRHEGRMMDMGAHWLMGSPSEPWNLSLSEVVYSYLKENFEDTLGAKDTEGLKFLERLRNPMLIGFLRIVAPSLLGVGGIISISDSIKEQIRIMFPDYPTDSVLTVPNGLKLDKFFPMEKANQAEILLELRTTETTGSRPVSRTDLDAKHIVVFTGKFVGWKNLDAFLRAIQTVERHFDAKGEKVLTFVVGSGSPTNVAQYEGLAERLELRRTYFLGQLPHATINKLNNLAKIGVYPSSNEPFGLVGIECMASGTPAITGTGGFAEFIDSTVGKVLNNPTDVAELSETIVTALTEDWKTKKGPDARARAESFDWGPKVDQYIDFYEKVMNGHHDYQPARVTRYDFVRLMQKLRTLRLSPQLIKEHLLRLAPEAEKAELPAELVRQALKHGSCVQTTKDIELVTRGIERKMEGLATRK